MISPIKDTVDKSLNYPVDIVKLEGIWKGLGFEKINNLEGEIKKIRQNSGKLLTKRINKWNI